MAQDFYDKVATRFGNYDNPAVTLYEYPNGSPEEIFREKLIEVSGEDKTALDAGCGDGRFTLSVAQYFKKIIGNDTSNLMLQAAKKLQQKKGVQNVELIEKSTHDLDFSPESFDVVYTRRAEHDCPLFYKVLKPGGYALAIDIGEKDAKELKEVFGRGQNFGEWNMSALAKYVSGFKNAGFEIIYQEDFLYNEFYPTYQDLDIFLQGVPIFQDYDSEKDRAYLKEYVEKFQKEKGIQLPRHRTVLVAKKP